MDWLNTSEIVFGRIADGRENLVKFQGSWFVDPYDKAFEILRGGGTKSEIIRAISISAYNSALEASRSMNGTGEEFDWPKELRQSAKENEIADECDKLSKNYRKGKKGNPVKLMELVRDVTDPERSGLVSSAEVDYSKFEELIPSGWDALDFNLGGIPHAAPFVVGGDTGFGKSFWTMRYLERFLTRYPDKVAAVYTLEMPTEQYLKRCATVYKMQKMISDGRLLISDRSVTIDDIATEMAGISNLGTGVIDYVDYLPTESSEDAYAKVYTRSNEICRTLQVPMCLIAQLNRNQYQSPVPKKYHLRYSGRAEQVAGQILMLWKPENGFDTDDTDAQSEAGFEFFEDSMYMLCWKNRAGWVGMDDDHPSLDGKTRLGPGAIVLPKSKDLWSTEKGRWAIYGDVPRSMKKSKRNKVAIR